jgi:hypothetical protein
MIKVTCPYTGERFWMMPEHQDYADRLLKVALAGAGTIRDLMTMAKKLQESRSPKEREQRSELERLQRQAKYNANVTPEIGKRLPLDQLWTMWRQSMDGLRLSIELGYATEETIEAHNDGIAWGKKMQAKVRKMKRARS